MITLFHVVLAQTAVAPPDDIGGLLKVLVGIFGSAPVAVWVTMWAMNKRNASKRAAQPSDDIERSPAVYALRTDLARTHERVNEGFHKLHGSVRDIAHGLEDASQQIGYVDDKIDSLIDEVRQAMGKIHGRSVRHNKDGHDG